MKVIVIDTETSGLFDFKQPADAPGQPRLAQFGSIKFDTKKPEDQTIFARYVKPEGWKMAHEASLVNGLTDTFLEQHGCAVDEVLDYYSEAILTGHVVVAYNAQFDCKVMRAELRHARKPDLFDMTPNICVMRPMTNICRLPGKYGFKFPKLAEACAHLGITNAKAHDAMGDAEGAREIFFYLEAMGLLPTPAVHLAKEAPAQRSMPV